MTLDNYDYETVNGKITSFTAITGIGMYSTAAFVRSSEEPQIRILNSGVLF